MAFENEAAVYEAMGLEPPAEEIPVQEVTEEAEATDTGAEEQVEAADAQEAGEGGEEPAKQEEDSLEKLRRELNEQHQKELERARAEGRRKLDESIASMGLKDPSSGEAITTWEQYQTFKDKRLENSLDSIARQTGMDRAELDKLIADHPEVRKAMQIQAEAQAAQEEANQKQLQQKLNDDIAAIAAECPEVTDLESLVNHPSYAAVEAAMRKYKGMGVADAFFLVNRTAIAAGKVNAEGQRVRNNMAGKNHLRQTGSRGNGGASMSKAQENMYHALLPHATKDDILKFHQENMKGA